ncbi:MAG: glycerol-3-phosphate acyltransferase, partial [Anaerolineae bacterium]
MALLWVLASYFLGAFPSAYIVARALKGIDIRQYGSGNVGGSNVRAHVSDAAFVAVGVADAAKGALAVAIGRGLGLDPWTVSAAAAAAMVGHNWSL